MRQEVIYFDKAGEENTSSVLDIAHNRFSKGDIDAVVIASTRGKTAREAAEEFEKRGIKLIFVGEVIDGKQSPPQDVCDDLEKMGHRVIWGLPMGQMSKFTRDDSAKLLADAYKRISEGFKVVCEIVLIATNAGYIAKGAKVISIAGTHYGADTAIVATASGYDDFMHLQVHELLCKPYKRA